MKARFHRDFRIYRIPINIIREIEPRDTQREMVDRLGFSREKISRLSPVNPQIKSRKNVCKRIFLPVCIADVALRARGSQTHLALYVEGSVPDGEGDAMQERLRLLPQRRFVLKIVVHGVLPGVAAAAAIRPQPSARQRAAVRARHRCARSCSRLLRDSQIPCIIFRRSA